MEKKISNTILISLPLLYFMLSCVLTSQKYRSIFNIGLSLFCGVIAYLVFLIASNGFNTKNELGLVVLSGVQIAIIGVSTLFITDSVYLEDTKNYLRGLLVLSISWLASIVLQEIDENSVKVLVRIYLFAIVLFSAFTLYVEFTGPENIIRNTAMGVWFDAKLIYGGFDFIYSIVIVYCVLFFYYMSNRKKLSTGNSFFIVISLIIIFLTVAFSNYSTAFLLVVVFSFAPFLSKSKHKIIISILLVFAFWVLSEPIADLIENLPLSELTTKRISSLIRSLTGNEGARNPIAGEGQRLDRIFWSLKIIVKNPIFGGFVANTTEQFGYHTEWIDKAAKHGLLYMVFHAAFWINARKKLVDFCKTDEEVNLIKTAFLVFIILGFLNPITLITTPAPLFLLCPFLSVAFPIDDKKILI